jgi:hypothetical protein
LNASICSSSDGSRSHNAITLRMGSSSVARWQVPITPDRVALLVEDGV